MKKIFFLKAMGTVAVASICAGLLVCTALPAQAATLTSAPVNILVSNNIFDIALNGGDASLDKFKCENINTTGKNNFSFSDTAVDNVLKTGTWSCKSGGSIVGIGGVSNLNSTNITIAVTDAARLDGGTWGAGVSVILTGSKAGLTSPFLTVNESSNALQITLLSGSFQNTGASVDKANYSFSNGAINNTFKNNAEIVLTRTSETVVVVSGFGPSTARILQGDTNVSVTADTMELGAASVALSQSGTSIPSTTTPAPAPILVIGNTIAPEVALVQSLSPGEVRKLPASQLSVFPPAAFRAMTAAQVRALRPVQVRQFNRSQVQAIRPSVLRMMKPKTLANFTSRQIRMIRPAQAKRLRQLQINALRPEHQRLVYNKR